MQHSGPSLSETYTVLVSVIDGVVLAEENISEDPSRSLGIGDIERHEGTNALHIVSGFNETICGCE